MAKTKPTARARRGPAGRAAGRAARGRAGQIKGRRERVELERAGLELAQAKLARKIVQAKLKFLSTYAAAKTDRHTRDWPKKPKSADEALITDLGTLNARARMAQRDDWSAESGASAYRRYIVGRGITGRAVARDPNSNDELKKFNERATILFARWARSPKLCDIERRKTLYEIEGLGAEEIFAVGQSLLVLAYEPREGSVGLVLQQIEPEQLNGALSTYKGNTVRGGIELDKYGGPVAYHIYTAQHPLETVKAGSVRIEADRVLDLIRQRRVRQTRGVTRMATGLLRMRHLGMYDEYEIIAKRYEACIGGIIQQDPAMGEATFGLKGASSGVAETDSTAKGNDQFNFEPGMFPRLDPGEKFELINPQRPGAVYGPFTERQLGCIAAGMGLDYATLTRDFSKGNFSSQRQALLAIWDELDPFQTLMIDVWLRPIWEQFINYAIIEGRLEAPQYFQSPEWREAYLEVEWQGPEKRWIDPAREAAAAKIAIDYRLNTRAQILNEKGRDWRSDFRQHADEAELARELEINLPDAGEAPDAGDGNGGDPKLGRAGGAMPGPLEEPGDGIDAVTKKAIADGAGPELAELIGEKA